MSRLSVIISSYKTPSRPQGQESEERKDNLFSTLIFLLCFYVMFFTISMKQSTLFHSSKPLTQRFIISIETSRLGLAIATRLGTSPIISVHSEFSIKTNNKVEK